MNEALLKQLIHDEAVEVAAQEIADERETSAALEASLLKVQGKLDKALADLEKERHEGTAEKQAHAKTLAGVEGLRRDLKESERREAAAEKRAEAKEVKEDKGESKQMEQVLAEMKKLTQQNSELQKRVKELAVVKPATAPPSYIAKVTKRDEMFDIKEITFVPERMQ